MDVVAELAELPTFARSANVLAVCGDSFRAVSWYRPHLDTSLPFNGGAVRARR